MANRIFQEPQIDLSQDYERPLFVKMEAFFEFSFWIAEELTDLIANHDLKERQPKPLAGSNAVAHLTKPVGPQGGRSN